ncbi:hypothetical protein [Haloplanus salilacus]|uniref:hypothetical protein n=1 Tax=Haloplanus salilacus TaxID=2949994 RepID=UPI0030D23DDA
MPQLRSCYFCGAVGDSLREYDLAPDDTVSEGSHSAVLCSTCHEKLRRVLEPLTDASSSEGSGGTVGEPSSTQPITFGADGASSGRGDETEAGLPTDRNGSDDAGEDGESTDDAGRGAEAGDDTDATGDERAGESADLGAGDSTAEEEPDVPEAYYKVLRLLQNREFPMERAELTTLVTAAYEVSEPQCERILETAIDRGVLVEDGATLDLGRN